MCGREQEVEGLPQCAEVGVIVGEHAGKGVMVLKALPGGWRFGSTPRDVVLP